MLAIEILLVFRANIPQEKTIRLKLRVVKPNARDRSGGGFGIIPLRINDQVLAFLMVNGDFRIAHSTSMSDRQQKQHRAMDPWRHAAVVGRLIVIDNPSNRGRGAKLLVA
jgi:hypothetical protein